MANAELELGGPRVDCSESGAFRPAELLAGDLLSIYQPRPLPQDYVDLVSHLGPRFVTEHPLDQ